MKCINIHVNASPDLMQTNCYERHRRNSVNMSIISFYWTSLYVEALWQICCLCKYSVFPIDVYDHWRIHASIMINQMQIERLRSIKLFVNFIWIVIIVIDSNVVVVAFPHRWVRTLPGVPVFLAHFIGFYGRHAHAVIGHRWCHSGSSLLHRGRWHKHIVRTMEFNRNHIGYSPICRWTIKIMRHVRRKSLDCALRIICLRPNLLPEFTNDWLGFCVR